MLIGTYIVMKKLAIVVVIKISLYEVDTEMMDRRCRAILSAASKT